MDLGIVIREAENIQKHPLKFFPMSFWFGQFLALEI
jgi:hypothetical protein